MTSIVAGQSQNTFWSACHSVDETLYRAERATLICSYKLGEKIEAGVIGRTAAIAIPAICLVSETVKIVVDLEKLISSLFHSLIRREVEAGNVHAFVLSLSEHGRNIAGIVTGLFFGLYSPAFARRAFLVVKDEHLKRKLNGVDAARLYATAHKVHNYFVSHKIDYRICSGSTLGAERHQGIIPWDDDIDIMIHPKSLETFEEHVMSGQFERETKLEIVWQGFTSGWQVFHPECPKAEEGKLKGIGTPFIDLFCMEENGDRIDYTSFNMRKIASEDYFTVSEWGVPRAVQFGPVLLQTIEEPLNYISRCYGRESLDFGYQTVHHEELAKMWHNPLDVKSNFYKICEYGLPRRTYIEDRSPINYDRKLFEQYIK